MVNRELVIAIIRKKGWTVLLISLLIGMYGLTGFSHPPVYAADTTTAVSVSVNTGCVGYLDGSTSTSYIDVTPGSTVNLAVTNQDDWVSQSISGSDFSTTTVGPVTSGSSGSTNVTTITLNSLTNPVTVSFTPIPTAPGPSGSATDNCPTGSSPTSTSLIVNPVSASLTCILAGSDWDITGNFSGSSLGSGLFSGTTQITPLSASGPISQGVTATTSAQNFSVVDGLNYSKSTPLATVTCPPSTSAGASSSPTSSNTTTLKPPTTATPVTKSTAGIKPLNTVTTAPKQVSSLNADILLKTGLGVVIIIGILLLLDATNIWTSPKHWLATSWRKLFKKNKRLTRVR